MNDLEDFNNYKLLTKYVDGFSINMLNKIGDVIKSRASDSILILASGEDNNLSLSCFVSGKALENNNAGVIMKTLAGYLDGSGGGRANMANGHGKAKNKLDFAFNEIKKLLK